MEGSGVDKRVMSSMTLVLSREVREVAVLSATDMVLAAKRRSSEAHTHATMCIGFLKSSGCMRIVSHRDMHLISAQPPCCVAFRYVLIHALVPFRIGTHPVFSSATSHKLHLQHQQK
jgi:ectoine hydroxylase-related dioxygenase (phytanoyl-CoA dioxygenase family)